MRDSEVLRQILANPQSTQAQLAKNEDAILQGLLNFKNLEKKIGKLASAINARP